MKGNELIRALDASGLRASVRSVWIFSASPLSNAEVRASSADGFIEKPFQVDERVSRLSALWDESVLSRA